MDVAYRDFLGQWQQVLTKSVILSLFSLAIMPKTFFAVDCTTELLFSSERALHTHQTTPSELFRAYGIAEITHETPFQNLPLLLESKGLTEGINAPKGASGIGHRMEGLFLSPGLPTSTNREAVQISFSPQILDAANGYINASWKFGRKTEGSVLFADTDSLDGFLAKWFPLGGSELVYFGPAIALERMKCFYVYEHKRDVLLSLLKEHKISEINNTAVEEFVVTRKRGVNEDKLRKAIYYRFEPNVKFRFRLQLDYVSPTHTKALVNSHINKVLKQHWDCVDSKYLEAVILIEAETFEEFESLVEYKIFSWITVFASVFRCVQIQTMN